MGSAPTSEDISDLFIGIKDLGFSVKVSLDWFIIENQSDLKDLFDSSFKISKGPRKGSKRCYTIPGKHVKFKNWVRM